MSDIQKKEPAFTHEDPWRIFRIMAEFVDSFEELSRLEPRWHPSALTPPSVWSGRRAILSPLLAVSSTGLSWTSRVCIPPPLTAYTY